jgi:hypothetical protein
MPNQLHQPEVLHAEICLFSDFWTVSQLVIRA